MTELQVRTEVIARAHDEIVENFPHIAGCDVDGLVKAVLSATVEAEADDTMRAYMTMIGWW